MRKRRFPILYILFIHVLFCTYAHGKRFARWPRLKVIPFRFCFPLLLPKVIPSRFCFPVPLLLPPLLLPCGRISQRIGRVRVASVGSSDTMSPARGVTRQRLSFVIPYRQIGIASPFGNNKKTRRRHRKKAKQQLAWADQHAAAGTKPLWNTHAMRRLAESNLRSAQRRRKKPTIRKDAG
jgi:hypothetical protein